ncbi:MAG: putative Fimbral protein [Candidatus Saccharibacteria bacterium]|nr:putative Fimbral protein [Candidatus Saccharibacteria bacterium]
MQSIRKNAGFTIVELLIVIVVIGILAAIVIVAYNGVQLKARNSSAVAAIQSYKKALTQYAIDHQAYPVNGAVCLGQDYPDTGVFTAASNRSCFRSSSSGVISTTFNNNIKPYMGNGTLPTPNNSVFGSGSSPWSVRGALMSTATGLILNGVANPWVLIYTLEGATSCPVGPIADVSAYPNTTSTPPSSGYSVLISGGTVGVECWLIMPDPAKV